MQTWLVIGHVENWETAFAQPIPLWGLRGHYARDFDELRVGDLIICYATNPVKGVIAVARVRDKYIDRLALVWPDEKRSGRVIWPLKFRLSEIEALPRSYWEARPGEVLRPISIIDFGLNWQVGFQRLSADQVRQVFDRLRSAWTGVELEVPVARPTEPFVAEPKVLYKPTPLAPVREPVDTHRRTQETLLEIGRLQHYFTESEFPIVLTGQQQRLDVVWKREHAGVPTFAFEIEFSGAIEKAVARLRVAFQQWNSQPRLVIDETDRIKVDNLVEREERAFRSNFRWVQSGALEKILKAKRDLRELEQQIGIS